MANSNHRLFTSQLHYNINTKDLLKDYDIIVISCSKPGSDIYYGNQIFSKIDEKRNHILSNVIDKKDTYILMKKDKGNISYIRELYNTLDDIDKSYLKVPILVKSNDVNQRILFKLLSASVPVLSNELFTYNNTGGKLYVLHKMDKKNKQCHCLEIDLNTNNQILIKSAIFTSEERRKDFDNPNAKLPPYVISDDGKTMRRANISDYKDNGKSRPKFYYNKQVRDKKAASVNFLNFSSLEDFNKSRLGILYDHFNKLKYLYGKYIEFSLNEPQDVTYMDLKHEPFNLIKNMELKLGFKYTNKTLYVCIVDEDIDPNYYFNIIKNCLNSIKFKYHFDKIKLVKRIQKGKYNLQVVHEKDYYKNNSLDTYINSMTDVIQHLTFETIDQNIVDAYKDKKENDLEDIINKKVYPVLQNCINCLFILDDIIKGKNSLINTEVLPIKEHIKFYVPKIDYKNKKIVEYLFMKLHKDNTLEFKVVNAQPKFSFGEEYDDETQKDIHLFDSENVHNRYNKTDIIGIIVTDLGDANVILDTDEFVIPGLDEIYQELIDWDRIKNNDSEIKPNTKYPSKSKDSLIGNSCQALLNIHYWKENQSFKYVVGMKEYNQYTFINANKIKVVIPIGDSNLLIDETIPMIPNLITKTNQLSVYPLPFKYINEYFDLIK